jgi:hypothetical protein
MAGFRLGTEKADISLHLGTAAQWPSSLLV